MGARSTQQWIGIAVVLALGPMAAMSCLSNDNPHDDEVSSFPLAGRHGAIPCESCHGDEEYGPLDPACESCHEAERPVDHYAGSCGEAGCHIPVGWKATGGVTIGDDDDDTTPGDDDDDVTPGDDDDDVTPGDDDDDTTPGDDDDTTPGDDDDDVTGTDLWHEGFPLEGVHGPAEAGCLDCHVDPTLGNVTERIVCLDCHEDDRDGADHYAGQDCAHCHPMVAGWGDNENHDFILPHPLPEPDPIDNDQCIADPTPTPVQLCISCHTDPTNRNDGNATCIGCHDEPDTDCRHDEGNFPGYVYADSNCKSCHEDGQE